MAFIYNLLDDSTTLQLNGGTDYALQPNTFHAPPPPQRSTFSGANLFRDGSDLMNRRFDNRIVTLGIWIKGTSQDDFIANVNAINDILERGSEYSRTGLGSQLVLRRQWDNATNTSDFNVLSGTLEITGDSGTVHRFSPSSDVRMGAVLTLLCEPFILGTAETIDNYVNNASFEIADTALVNWAQNIDATGSTSRDTTQYKYGLSSLKLIMTDSGSSGQVVERTQVRAEVDATEVWSFSVWVHVTALSNAKAGIVLLYDDGSATTTTSYQTSVTSGWTQLTLANQTVPSGAGQVTIKLRLESTAADATGTAYFDGALAVLSASVPESYVSGRAVGNIFADDSQATTNYIDIHPIGGDVPALLQIYALEGTDHTSMWAGARHGSRMNDADLWLEGETFSGATIAAVSQLTESATTQAGMNTGSAALDSESSVGHYLLTNSSGGSYTVLADTWFRAAKTVTAQPIGQYRVLIRAGWESDTSTVASQELNWGFGVRQGDYVELDATNPSTTNFVAFESSSAETVGHLLDLGTVTIPTIKSPTGLSSQAFDIRVYAGTTASNATTDGQKIEWFLDAVMLMPIDEGSAYLSKTAGTDLILIDSRSNPSGVYLLDTSTEVATSFPPNQLGSPIFGHPDGTRVYFVFGTGATNTWVAADSTAVKVTVVPRYLYVR
jgi:hypothetical protein